MRENCNAYPCILVLNFSGSRLQDEHNVSKKLRKYALFPNANVYKKLHTYTTLY